jgi:hypothetical protein
VQQHRSLPVGTVLKPLQEISRAFSKANVVVFSKSETEPEDIQRQGMMYFLLSRK